MSFICSPISSQPSKSEEVPAKEPEKEKEPKPNDDEEDNSPKEESSMPQSSSWWGLAAAAGASATASAGSWDVMGKVSSAVAAAKTKVGPLSAVRTRVRG